MPALQRSVSIRGPRFFRDGETEMFVNYLDASTRDGPRKATKEDRANHADAYAAFKAEKEAEGLRPMFVPITPPSETAGA